MIKLRKKYLFVPLLIFIAAILAAFFLLEKNEPARDLPWELTLVNYENKIPDDYKFSLSKLPNGLEVDSRIYVQLMLMLEDMESEGIYAVVGEGYRTSEAQQKMMDDRISAYINEGYSEKKAQRLAEQYVAKDGFSEHQLGLAVDINADKARSTNDEVYSWLAENAYQYGFIERYPQDKENTTKIAYEPWHYRFVGLDAAKEIYGSKLSLEEYTEKYRK